MGNLLTYSAITAKIRAMQGRLLKEEDFLKLAARDSVPAAVEMLKTYPSYRQVFAGLEDEELHREQIERLLWLSLYQDYSSLYRFASVRQRDFLDLYFMHFEIDIMKKCLRDASSSRESQLDLSVFEDFFKKHSRLDLTGLAECTSLSGFVDGLAGSYYHEPLHKLYEQGVTALFDYESALDSLYFIRLWGCLKKQLGRREQEAVCQCIGEKIDLLNLEWLSRAKQYYHLSEDSVWEFLIPVFYRLRKKQVRNMAAAATWEDFLAEVRGTRYGSRIFSDTGAQQDTRRDFRSGAQQRSRQDAQHGGASPGGQYGGAGYERPKLKPLFRSLLDAVYQNSGRKNPYSAAVLNTYFYFKEEEIRKLITTIEGIRYKLDEKEILSCLAES